MINAHDADEFGTSCCFALLKFIFIMILPCILPYDVHCMQVFSFLNHQCIIAMSNHLSFQFWYIIGYSHKLWPWKYYQCCVSHLQSHNNAKVHNIPIEGGNSRKLSSFILEIQTPSSQVSYDMLLMNALDIWIEPTQLFQAQES